MKNAISFVRAMNSELQTHFYQISDSKKQRNSCTSFSESELFVWVFCIAASLHGDYNNDSYIKFYGAHETFLKQTVEIKEKWL
jgi:hypothetical protein